MSDIQRAIMLLNENNYSSVFVKDDIEITTKEKGIKPLLDRVQADDVAGFCAADTVIGKAAALFYVLLKVKKVYARLLSEEAKEILENEGIEVSYLRMVPYIKNRDRTDMCPMEKAVRQIDSPEQAVFAVKEALRKMKKQKA